MRIQNVFFLLFATALGNIAHAQTTTVDQDETRLEKWNRADSMNQKVNLHFQMTYINQIKPRMHADYSGPYSLQPQRENQNSLTSTAFVGLHLWKGSDFFFNPELAGGSGLSGAQGMGGSSNGETFRVGNPSPQLYVARAVLQQTFALDKVKENQDDDENQLAERIPDNYIKISAGKFSLADIFDNNEYSNSPRTQFLNWSIMNNASWDFAANVRGYTYTLAGEWDYSFFNLKVAAATLPKEANGAALNTHLSQELALNTELGFTYHLRPGMGHLRLLYFNNKADMGSYAEAIQQGIQQDTVPNIIATRKNGRHKWGLGLNADQDLNNGLGAFLRAGFNDGKIETWNFTEVDKTLSLGLVQNGKLWKRKDDNVGFALAFNGLSKNHSTYLKNGGNGFILGDGTLNYGTESILETYYDFKPFLNPIWLTVDYQFAVNPGYNKDRGPANIFSFRVHVEF